jgi:hypothetical protein
MAMTRRALALGVFLALGGCAGTQPPPTESTAAPVTTLSATASASPEPTDSCGSADLWIDYASYTTATLAGYGWDFVVADVVGFDPAIFNTPGGSRPPGFGTRPSSPKPNPNAETLIYTPVNVVIDRAISGPWSPGPIQFLVEGGTVGCYTMRVDDVPRVNPGSRYVIILSEALDAEGLKPLPLQKARFAWPVDSAGLVSTVDGLMSIDELTKVVSGSPDTTSTDIPAH